MADTVEYLIDNHDLISAIEPLPYIPGRTKIVLNDRPTYPDEEKDMRLPRELNGGYYLETHNSKEGKRREFRRLVELCGLEIEFEADQ
jgi:hypothetical protein